MVFLRGVMGKEERIGILKAEEQMREEILQVVKTWNKLPELGFFKSPLMKSEGKPICFLMQYFQLYH